MVKEIFAKHIYSSLLARIYHYMKTSSTHIQFIRVKAIWPTPFSPHSLSRPRHLRRSGADGMSYMKSPLPRNSYLSEKSPRYQISYSDSSAPVRQLCTSSCVIRFLARASLFSTPSASEKSVEARKNTDLTVGYLGQLAIGLALPDRRPGEAIRAGAT